MKKTIFSFVLAAAILALVFIGPSSFKWHIKHGNQVLFESHHIPVPLTWAVSESAPGQLVLVTQPPVGTVASIEIAAQGEPLDQKAADIWRSQKLQAQRDDRNSDRHPLLRKLIKSSRLDFDCLYSLEDGSALMYCRSVGTNWKISVMGKEKGLKSAESIIEKIE